jgi:hypothetical protein
MLINCFVAELRVRIVARKDAGGRASRALPATTRTQRAAILAAETHEWIIQQSPSWVVGKSVFGARVFGLVLRDLLV